MCANLHRGTAFKLALLNFTGKASWLLKHFDFQPFNCLLAAELQRIRVDTRPLFRYYVIARGLLVSGR